MSKLPDGFTPHYQFLSRELGLPFAPRMLYVELMRLRSFEREEIVFGGVKLMVGPNHLRTTYRDLAEITGYGKDKCRATLDRLVNLGLVRVVNSVPRVGMLLHIPNVREIPYIMALIAERHRQGVPALTSIEPLVNSANQKSQTDKTRQEARQGVPASSPRISLVKQVIHNPDQTRGQTVIVPNTYKIGFKRLEAEKSDVGLHNVYSQQVNSEVFHNLSPIRIFKVVQAPILSKWFKPNSFRAQFPAHRRISEHLALVAKVHGHEAKLVEMIALRALYNGHSASKIADAIEFLKVNGVVGFRVAEYLGTEIKAVLRQLDATRSIENQAKFQNAEREKESRETTANAERANAALSRFRILPPEVRAEITAAARKKYPEKFPNCFPVNSTVESLVVAAIWEAEIGAGINNRGQL